MITLFIDCCINGEKSATRRYAEAWIAKYVKSDIEILRLIEEDIHPLYEADINRRGSLIAAHEFHDDMFRYARQFQFADQVIIAAPLWDLSFPSLLKIYFENIAVCGINIIYDCGRSIGCAHAKTVHYFATCGGFYGKDNLATQYVKGICCGMFGVKEFEAHVIDGLDIDKSKREEILAAEIAKL